MKAEVPYIPVDGEYLQRRSGFGNSLNSTIRDFLAPVKIQTLQVFKGTRKLNIANASSLKHNNAYETIK